LIDYFKLRYLLKLAGFEKLEVYTDRYSPASLALSWLVPVLYIATRVSIGVSGKKFRGKYKIAVIIQSSMKSSATSSPRRCSSANA
jgi:arginine exporter protein ArgO